MTALRVLVEEGAAEHRGERYVQGSPEKYRGDRCGTERDDGRDLSEAGYSTTERRAPLERAALTDREQEVLRLVARGLSNAEIAAGLTVGVETVKPHVSSIAAKLGARDRTQAVIAAYEPGFVAPS